jgi:hypothetical protein
MDEAVSGDSQGYYSWPAIKPPPFVFQAMISESRCCIATFCSLAATSNELRLPHQQAAFRAVQRPLTRLEEERQSFYSLIASAILAPPSRRSAPPSVPTLARNLRVSSIA